MRIAHFNSWSLHFSDASQKAGDGCQRSMPNPGGAASVQRAATRMCCRHNLSRARQTPCEQQHGTGRLLAQPAVPCWVPAHKGRAKYGRALYLDFLSSLSGEL